MSKEKKKIVVLFAGGTCLLDKQGHILTIKEKTDIDSWLQQMPELNILADIKPILISGEDEIITSQIWEKLALTILDNFVEADGFVVVTKIDQLIETSLALDFMLQHFQKTIITTSSYVSGTSFVDKKETINTLKSKFGGEDILICGHKNFLTCLEILLTGKDIKDYYSFKELENGEIREFANV